jgi:hypothetical protein
MASPPPSTPTRGAKPRSGIPPQKGRTKTTRDPTKDADLSVFDILNIFRRRWFLSRSHLLTNVISAQKAEDGDFLWVEFSPQYHSHLVKCTVALVPHPVPKVKKVMFVYILELLSGKGNQAFFNLQKGGRKANNAQKEKRRLARKRSCAAKREREREAAKAAKLPPRERQCLACGRKFKSRKTSRKHKCSKAKVARIQEKAAEGSASLPTPLAQMDKPSAPPAPPAPTAPSNSNAPPAVTGDSQGSRPPGTYVFQHKETGMIRKIRDSDLEYLRDFRANDLWIERGWVVTPS